MTDINLLTKSRSEVLTLSNPISHPLSHNHDSFNKAPSPLMLPSPSKQKSILLNLLKLNPLIQNNSSNGSSDSILKVALISSDWWNNYKQLIQLDEKELSKHAFNDQSRYLSIAPFLDENPFAPGDNNDALMNDDTTAVPTYIGDNDEENASMLDADNGNMEIDAALNAIPEIDNFSLLDLKTINEMDPSMVPRLREGVFENLHFNYISIEAFEKLLEWFGGGPKIYRPLVWKDGIHSKLIVNLEPVSVQVAVHEPGEKYHNFVNFEVYKGWNMEQLRTNYLNLHPQKDNLTSWRTWKAYCGSPHKVVDDEKYVSDLLRYVDNRSLQLLFEGRGEYDKFSISESLKSPGAVEVARKPALSTSSLNSGGLSSRFLRKENSGNSVPAIPGLCGLENLGNTCFMNSALQCLTKTPQIREYFLSGDYEKEINIDNPLGMKGEIATAFADIMQLMWSGKHSKISPKGFKHVIGKRAPQFIGYQQHDSCELIQYLIDGIHEDLNRIYNKPYTITVEGENLSDEELSTCAWKVHMLRNDSIVVDRFSGQLKSVLKCPICKNVSTTFDPFLYLPLPLPSPEKKIELFIVTSDLSNPWRKCSVPIKSLSTFADLRETVSKMVNVPPQNLVFADVLTKIYKYLTDSRKLYDISPSDNIYAYEVPNIDENDYHTSYSRKDLKWIELTLKISKKESESYSYGSSSREKKLFDFPILVPYVAGQTTNKDIYNYSLMQVFRIVPPDHRQQLSVIFEDLQSYLPNQESSSSDVLFSLINDNFILPYNDECAMLTKYDNFSSDVRTYKLVGIINAEMKEVNGVQIHQLIAKGEINPFQDESRRYTSTKTGVTLENCFETFQSTEQLGEMDKWRCKVCKDFVQAEKTIQIWKLPEVLVIQLKRFQFLDRYGGKIETHVEFPLDNLDLSKFVPEGVDHTQYELFAVSNHFGSIGGGHYIAHAKVQDKWYQFDDPHVRPVGASSICTSDAYVLFYTSKKKTSAKVGEKRDGKELAQEWGLQKHIQQ